MTRLLIRSMLARIGVIPYADLPGPIAFKRFSQLCKRSGLNQLYVILSFDCDTDQDAEAALSLDGPLRKDGIKSTYAVPGEQLTRSAEKYRKIAEAGSRFINHGAQPHTQFRDGRNEAITFYNEMKTEEVIDDIEAGHAIVQDVSGQPPRGFRAPHFGYYQYPEQLDVIYRTAKKLEYTFCTTTLPRLALNSGPAIAASGLHEFPLTGSLQKPNTILDSWNYLDHDGDRSLMDSYGELFLETVDFFLERKLPGVLNFYVDPAHVVDAPPFHRAIRHLVDNDVPTLHYEDLLNLITTKKAGN